MLKQVAGMKMMLEQIADITHEEVNFVRETLTPGFYEEKATILKHTGLELSIDEFSRYDKQSRVATLFSKNNIAENYKDETSPSMRDTIITYHALNQLYLNRVITKDNFAQKIKEMSAVHKSSLEHTAVADTGITDGPEEVSYMDQLRFNVTGSLKL